MRRPPAIPSAPAIPPWSGLAAVGIALAAMLSIASCSGSGETVAEGHRFEIRAEEGVPVAVTTGGPRYEGELFTYEEAFRVRQDPEIEQSLLSRPSNIVVASDGAVYVEDSASSRIARFGPDGVWTNDIGRAGEGPGEFRNLAAFSVTDGEFLAYDRRLRRVSRFRTDGMFLDDITVPPMNINVQFYARGPGGEHLFLGDLDEGAINAPTMMRGAALVLDAEGDTLTFLDTSEVKRSQMFFMEESRMGGMAWVYYNGWPSARYHPDRGIILGMGTEGILREYGLDGTLQRIVRLEVPAEPLTQADRDGVLDGLRESRDRSSDESRKLLYEQYLQRAEFRDPKAYWWNFYVSDDAYTWAIRPGALIEATGQGEPPRPIFRMLSPEGEYLGDTRIPVPNGTFWGGRFVAVVENEETGELDVVVYRIIPIPAGFEYP